jgi:drug/metabolite transporter (DMT)-like permease
VCAVVIPVAAAVLLGERPPLRALAGIAVAIVAIVLVAQHDGPAAPAAAGGRAGPAGFGLALMSGVLIGLFFLALARTSATAGMWPLVSARAVSVVLFAAFALVTRRSVVTGRATIALMVAAGATDMLANALYLLATRFGPLSGVVTLASLYPASTITLARVVLGERLTTRQAAGIACAIVAVVLIVG